MVSMDVQELAITTGAVFNEFCHSGNRGSTRTGHTGDFAVTEAFAKLPRNLQTFAPCLQFAERADITQEVANLFFALAREQGMTESFEPGFSLVAVFGEALAGGHDRECNRTMRRPSIRERYARKKAVPHALNEF